jgi:two-component system, cell cycle sensor histidine kinase PleC
MILVGLLGLLSIGSLALAGTLVVKHAALMRAHNQREADRQAHIEALDHEVEKRKAIVDELRTAKEAAERASRSKSQFLANMSHELRTPLNAIIGFAELIAGEVSGPVGTPIYKQYAEDIVGGGKQLFDILTNILDMARIEAGKAGVSESEFQIGDAMQSAVRLCAMAHRPDKSIQIICDDPSPVVRADERMIRQALVGLISNALKFTEPGGQVIVTAHASAEEGLDLWVTDAGPGIPADKLGQIMEPFSQIEDVYTKRAGGLGLGLPLARALAELHGGDLSIESDSVRGTRVCLHLPPPRVVLALGQSLAATA